MPVPTSGNFDMFGTANTTIQGAINEGGGSAGAINNFNDLINASNIDLFDPGYSGDAVDLSNIKQSLQYRNYPKFFTAVTIGTNSGSGFSSASNACTNTGSIATVYLSDGGVQSLYEAYLDGKRLWANSSLTTPYNGGNLWFKTSALANNGDSFQIGTDGFIQSWGGLCIVPSSPSISCGVQSSYNGGQSYPSEDSINLGSDTGVVTLTIDPKSFPDRFIVTWNSVIVIDTGYRGSSQYNYGGVNRDLFTNQLTGQLDPTLLVTYPNFTEFPDDGYPLVTSSLPSFTFNKSTASPTFAVVKVYAPQLGTVWFFTLSCPSPS